MPKWRSYNEETKKQAIKLYMEGNSGRAVTIKEKRYPNERVEVIEMDELYSFIERKKRNLHNNSSE